MYKDMHIIDRVVDIDIGGYATNCRKRKRCARVFGYALDSMELTYLLRTRLHVRGWDPDIIFSSVQVTRG